MACSCVLQAGVLSELRGSLLVGAQYLADCHTGPGEFVAQVSAHCVWGSRLQLEALYSNWVASTSHQQYMLVTSIMSCWQIMPHIRFFDTLGDRPNLSKNRTVSSSNIRQLRGPAARLVEKSKTFCAHSCRNVFCLAVEPVSCILC